jgi:hypothetical protein
MLCYSCGMSIQSLRLDEVDDRDETCRISEDLDPPHLETSLREVGQLNPVVLIDRGSARLTIVCGFRRLRALRRLGQTSAQARVLPAHSLPLPEAFRLALWDNLSHRHLTPLETARVLSTLRHACGLPEDSILKHYMPVLGLDPHLHVLRTYLGLHAVHPKLRAQFSEGRLTLATAERLARKPAAFQEAFAAVTAGVRLTASLQRQVLDLVEEVAARDSCPEVEIILHHEIAGIPADAKMPPHEKGQKIHDFLYRQRFPGISAAEDRFAAAAAGLGLPGDIHFHHDRYFERPAIRVEFAAQSAARFRELVSALERATRAPGIDTLFQVR